MRYDLYTKPGDCVTIRDSHIEDLLVIDAFDVDAAIEEAGWCGTQIGGSLVPCALVPHGDDLPADAIAYLQQGTAK